MTFLSNIAYFLVASSFVLCMILAIIDPKKFWFGEDEQEYIIEDEEKLLEDE